MISILQTWKWLRGVGPDRVCTASCGGGFDIHDGGAACEQSSLRPQRETRGGVGGGEEGCVCVGGVPQARKSSGLASSARRARVPGSWALLFPRPCQEGSGAAPHVQQRLLSNLGTALHEQ